MSPRLTPGRILVLSGTAALAVLAIPPTGAQDAAGVQDVGWWSQQPAASAQPEDGVQLTWAAESAQSVAALHVVVPDVEGEVLLVLEETGGLATDRAAVDLCVTTSSWTPANPGAWGDRPTVDCEADPPTLGRDATALEWTGSIDALLAGSAPGDIVGVVLQPQGVPPAAGLPITPPFQLDLSGATLQVLDTGGPPTTAPPATSVTDPTFTDPAVGDPEFAPPDLGGSGFDAGPLPDTPATTVPTVEENDPGDDFVGLGPIDGTSGTGRPWWRVALLVPISLFGGFGAAFARRGLRTLS